MPIVGDVLADRYRIESVLGFGGMASVYQATDLRLDRQVAVKVLATNLAADAQFAERFAREAGAMAGFSHPNVAAVYDVEPGDPATGREPFYVMEYCRGGSLADRLKSEGRMPAAELLPIVAGVAEGLAELHRRGLIHRDVKPANILFAGDRPKLADFGVVWSPEPRDGDPLTSPGSTPGTAPYLAPELLAGEPPSAASDVYALGVTTFLSLTGQFPQRSAVSDSQPDSRPGAVLPVSAAAPDLGQRFDAALTRALDVDPEVRSSPVELAAQLATGLEIWGVAVPNPGAIPAPLPLSGAPASVDVDAPTRVAPGAPTAPPREAARQPLVPPRPEPHPPDPEPAGSPRPAPQPAATRRSAAWPLPWDPARYGRRAVPIALAVLAVLVLAAVILPRLADSGAAFPSASARASAVASASASSSAIATPTALPSGAQAILDALGRVDAAIEAARGGKDGLTGRDANELVQLAGAVRTAVDKGDLDAAATAARKLADRARAVAKGLDKPRRDALLAAIDGLLAALPPG